MTKTEETKEVVSIKPPDLSKIQKIDCEQLLAIQVTDDASCASAVSHGKTLKEVISQIEQEFKEPKAAAHKLHSWLCSTEKKAVEPLSAALDHLEKQVASFLPQREERRVALAQRLQEAQEELPPWEQEEIHVPVTPPPAGVKEHFKPWSYELKSLRDLLNALLPENGTLSDELSDPENPAFDLNKSFWTPKAREMQSHLHEKYPGVYGVRGKKRAI